MRIKFEQDRPTILHAKRNEAKIVVFDVLSLHRYVIIMQNVMLTVSNKRRHTPQLIMVVGVARQRERAKARIPALRPAKAIAVQSGRREASQRDL